MLNYWSWRCWFFGNEDASFTSIEDAGFMLFKMLIHFYWGFWFFGTEDATFTEIEDVGFMVFRMLGNGTDDADLFELRVVIYWC